MRKALVCALAVAFLSGSAFAGGKVWDDLSWWGQSGATPGVVEDTGAAGCMNIGPRVGYYWWWPKEPASNQNDGELWGNRGVVYGMYEEPAPPEPPKAAEPPKVAPPKVKREKPVLNHVLFDFDKSVLKAEGKAISDEVVAMLKEHAKDTVVVQGHTCNVGEEDYNMGLGQRRADAIKKYLVDNGIAESRVTTKSFGETEPAVANDTPANRKLNRRGVFDITVVD